jgi:hypothetical protein
VRHVILEGPDGAGKTQLAQLLCKVHGFSYHHEGPPPAGVESLLHYYANILHSAQKPTVFDRFHLGEMVYGPILRGQQRLTGAESLLMNRLLHGTGSVVIGCLPEFGTCLRNNRNKEELIKDERILFEAYQSWFRLMHTAGGSLLVNGFIYDYTAGVPIQLPATFELDKDAIGRPGAKFLFVGEQPNGELDLPFFSTNHRSSGYLNEALKLAGFEERQLAFTNARKLDGTPRNLARVVLGFRKRITVVALGKVAETTLKDQDVQHMGVVDSIKSLPHPAFWKRFHASKQQDYIDMLREVRAYAA